MRVLHESYDSLNKHLIREQHSNKALRDKIEKLMNEKEEKNNLSSEEIPLHLTTFNVPEKM